MEPMEVELKKMVQVWSSAMASLCYCHFVSSRIPKGKLRLISLLPVISLFTLLPLHLTFAVPTIFTALFLVWIANFRLLLFAAGLGPLSHNPTRSLPIFIALACFPVKIAQNQNRPSPKLLSKWILNLPTETLLLSLVTAFADRYKELLNLNPTIKAVLYSCGAFLLVDVVVTTANAVVVPLLGLELGPPSDEPFFATSLQDFWGRRWNLTVTNHLRHTVYEPVRSTFGPVVGRKWAGLIGAFATFVVSGLMHELLLYYSARVNPTWEQTGFFLLHGLCVILEYCVKRAVAGRCRLHQAVSAPLTVGFVIASNVWLFFPPITRVGLDERMLDELKLFLNFLNSCYYSIVKSTSWVR